MSSNGPLHPLKSELLLLSALTCGNLIIDNNGAIWRTRERKGNRNGTLGRHLDPPRRAENMNQNGYLRVAYRVNGQRVQAAAHRLVWTYFNGEIPDGYTIDHKNKIRDDNRPTNLDCIPHGKNVRLSFDRGSHSPPQPREKATGRFLSATK